MPIFIAFNLLPFFFRPLGYQLMHFKNLAKALRNRKLHINFHEIWIGAHPNAKWKENILGWFQKKRNQILYKKSVSQKLLLAQTLLH